MKKVQTDQTPAFLNKVYSELLGLLDLSLEHTRALNNRGLTSKEILKLSYKSLPLRKQELVAALIKNRLGGLEPKGVPGFWKNKDNWDLAGKTGFLIPIREKGGLITGLKIRVDKPLRASLKYVMLSSNPKSDKAFPQGTAAKTSVHWPLDKPRGAIRTVRITEGELKADVASSLTEVYTLSIPGVRMWRKALDAVKEMKGLEEVRLAFDADKNEEKAGATYGDEDGVVPIDDEGADGFLVGKACAELYLLLKEQVPRVVIEDWPAEAGKGIDDVLLNGAQDKIECLEGEKADEWANDMLHGELPTGWSYIVGIKQFIHAQTHLTLDKEQFNDRFRREIKGTPANVVLSNPAFPLYDSPIYLPEGKVGVTREGRKFFNLWRGNESIAEDRKTKATPFLDHIEFMIPSEDERRIFLDFLAWNVQKPGQKILWALLLQSKEGVGKSYFGDIMGSILGKHNISKPSNDEIHEIYTGWAKNCSLVIIEELMARGRMDLMNRLKPIITQSDIQIREMYLPPYNQPNVFNILIFTNYEDSLITGEDDRRYCVIYSKEKAREADYYRKLWDWTRENLGAVYSTLKNRDLSSFDPQARAPHTSWKEQLIYASLPPLQMWMRECIETETWPFQGDIVGTLHLHKCLPRSLQYTSLKALGDGLKAVGCRCYPSNQGQIEFKTGARIRAWSVRRHEIWGSAGAGTWVAEYEKWSAASEPGNPMWDARPL